MNKWPEQPRALISYAYIKPDDRLPADFDLLIDSGAYTAHTKGKEVDLGSYMQFLADRAGQYRAAFSLDVIGDPAASMRNYRIMRRNLPDEIRLIPTWHVGSGWDEYRAVIDSGAPLVGIGGAVAHSSRRIASQLTRGCGCMGSGRRACRRCAYRGSRWTRPRGRTLAGSRCCSSPDETAAYVP